MRKEKLRINNLVIEVTRKCNLKCAHCLRGGVQRIDIDPNNLENFFKQVEYVSSVTFTGGEPGLVPHILMDILAVVKKHKVDIGSFYVVTNGTIETDAFILALVNWYMYCSDNELTHVDVSMDIFHQEARYEINKDFDPQYSKLKALGFFGMRGQDIKSNRSSLLAEGRAKNKNMFPNATKVTKDRTYIVKEDSSVEGMIYVNALGEIIIAGCDFSYSTQKKLVVGTVADNMHKIIPIWEEL